MDEGICDRLNDGINDRRSVGVFETLSDGLDEGKDNGPNEGLDEGICNGKDSVGLLDEYEDGLLEVVEKIGFNDKVGKSEGIMLVDGFNDDVDVVGIYKVVDSTWPNSEPSFITVPSTLTL